MPRNELDKLAVRIAEIQSMMRVTQSDDVRQMLRDALAACEQRRAELEHEPVSLAGAVAVAADQA
jgi:hypothetical protein